MQFAACFSAQRNCQIDSGSTKTLLFPYARPTTRANTTVPKKQARQKCLIIKHLCILRARSWQMGVLLYHSDIDVRLIALLSGARPDNGVCLSQHVSHGYRDVSNTRKRRSNEMLVLSRKTGERILIGDDVAITVVRIGPNSVRIGIEAPRSMNIVREELCDFGEPTKSEQESESSPALP